MRSWFAVVVAAVGLTGIHGVAAADPASPEAIAGGLLPHRAVYDISLNAAASSSDITAVSGRLVFEVTGAPCEGFTVNSRFVTEVDNQDGDRRVTDLRSSTYESGDGNSFDFLSRTFTGQRLQQEAKGSARRGDDGNVTVELTEPEQATFSLPGNALFPTQQLIELIAKAEAGAQIVQSDLYDGSDVGRTVYTTTAVIGRISDEPITGGDPRLADAVGTTRHWPVSLAYFDLSDGESGELTPVYTLKFLVYENGVSRALTLDYGNFSLSGKLVELDRLPKASCSR
ncbi:cell envelope integrity EipB family protein [Amorphus sp. 3PC139-8]|uniref:cell envelope integrity EipB family protein n=1 Tax=Amorphus sp. 3PC139-8 TaxID=2735676 RepID=UPI00345D3844